jgi:hypothetical protein
VSTDKPVPKPQGISGGRVGALAERFLRQAGHCRAAGSPLTAALLEGAGHEMTRRGATRDLLAPLADEPAGAAVPLRFAGALHRLVLERLAPALALHYPSVGGTPDLERVWPLVRDVVEALDGSPVLPELLQRPVQTNEVGRSAVLLGGLFHLTRLTDRPVRLLEIGASAGLNLRVDHFAYEIGDEVRTETYGDRDSPVRLRQPWAGALPAYAPVEIVERRGCDPDPLDPLSTPDRLTLTSYVWADQVERLERLRGAFTVAQRVPATVERLSAAAFLAREARPTPGVTTVVWHSVVWQYLSPDERAAVQRELSAAAATATRDAPLAHLRVEPEQVGAQELRFVVSLTLWPGGQTRQLATAQGHGPPVTWQPGLGGWPPF